MDYPLFSIIIPTYNRASFLWITLQSVLDQNFQNWECLVIDDGSTDNTKEVVFSSGDPRLKYFHKEHEERSIARNFGIKKAEGEYICFLDSDDIFYPNHLEVLSTTIAKKNFPIAIFSTGLYENRGVKKVVRPMFTESLYSHPLYFIWERFMLPTSVCMHHEILKRHLFPEEYNVWEDTHLWLRVVAEYPFFQIEDITAQWNIHKESSVYKSFRKIDKLGVQNYIDCITDLFQNYGDSIGGYLDKEDMKEYQLKKLELFMEIAFQKKQFLTFLYLYNFGLWRLNCEKLNGFIYSLVMNKFRRKIHSVKKKML